MVSRRQRALARTAAVLAWIPGLGFGLFDIPAIWYFAHHHTVGVFIGYPTYGNGPFEDIGIPTTLPLLGAFMLVCIAATVTGWLLWRNHPAAPAISVALLPVEFAFWIGFSLPAGPPLGLIRTALIAKALLRSRSATPE